MTQTHGHDRRTQRLSARTEILPMVILAAILAAIVLVMTYQQPERMGDTNAGPSVQTVTPAPSPSTSPAVPTTEQPNTPPAP